MQSKIFRRVILFVVILGILECNNVFADVSDLQPKEQFVVYVGQLDDYLADPNSSEGYDINSICNSLKKVYGYDGDKGIAFYAYAMVIRDIDLAKWDDVYKNLTIIENNPSFQEYVSSEEFQNTYSQIRSVDVLKAYCNGRVAEVSGQWQNAIDSYWPAVCVGFYDSYSRWESASDSLEQQKDDTYNYGLDLYYNQNALYEAASTFQSLGSYKDSEALYNEIIGIISENKMHAVNCYEDIEVSNKCVIKVTNWIAYASRSAVVPKKGNRIVKVPIQIENTGDKAIDIDSTFDVKLCIGDDKIYSPIDRDGFAKIMNRDGKWNMVEYRKDANNDIHSFSFYLNTRDNNSVDWGIPAESYSQDFDIEKQLMSLSFSNGRKSYYLFINGKWGGGGAEYSGIAGRTMTEKDYETSDSIIGLWHMSEYRHDKVHDDVISYDVNILSVDSNGNMDIEWGWNRDRIKGKWDADRHAFTVWGDQVYICYDDAIGGGNKNISGLALRADSPGCVLQPGNKQLYDWLFEVPAKDCELFKRSKITIKSKDETWSVKYK